MPQRRRLARAVDHRPGQPSGQLSPGDLQGVGRRVVQPEVGREAIGELGEPPADDAAAETQVLQGPDERAGARRKLDLRPHLVEHARVQAGQQGHPLTQRCREIGGAVHRRGRDLGDLFRAAGPGREQVDHLGGDQGGVHVHDDQAHGAPVQAAALDRHIDPLLCRLAGERRAQDVRVRSRHVEFDAGHRLVGEPVDPVDVRPAHGDLAGDRGHRAGQQRAAHDGDMEPPAPPRQLAPAGGDLRFQVQVGGQVPDRPVDPGEIGVAVAGQQHAEDQAAADHHLLDVRDGQFVGGQVGEQPGGDPGPVTAGQGHQDGGAASSHRA